MSDWRTRVVQYVALAEGGGAYDALNLNTDGAGLSAFLLQWTQTSEQLHQLVSRFAAAYPSAWASVMGSDAPAVLDVLAQGDAGRDHPVAGARLWEGAWVARWKKLGNLAEFQRHQLQHALAGDHWRATVAAAKKLGVRSARAITLLFDTAINQGPSAVRKAVDNANLILDGHRPTEADKLVTVAALAVAYRRYLGSTPPTSRGRTTWREVTPGEWHVFLGRTDLFEVARGRKDKILNDPTLSDAPVLETA